MQRWSISSGPGPGTTASLAAVAIAAGPHRSKLEVEGAVTPPLQEIGLYYFQTVFLKYFRAACLPLGIMVFIWVPLLSIQTSVWIQPAVPFGQEAPYLPGLCHKNPETTSPLLIRLLKQCVLPLSSLRGLQILLP